MAAEDNDVKKIKELIEIMKNHDLVEIEISHGDEKISLKRALPQQPTTVAVPMAGSESAAAQVAPTRADLSRVSRPQQQEQLTEIKSPIVGTFYATPSPESEPYVEIGSHVELQTVVCTVEAMKVMNEIRAETTGTVVEILVTNGQAVEYGQVLFRVKPD
jgi:acetyl-CoA carboxylase biotin carboxyl carrier protein